MKQPDTEDELRPISLTADLSRDFNKFLVSLLLAYIRHRFHPAQFGGMKGGSITHYLILFFHFILSNTDHKARNPKAIIASYIDFSKGFNRLNHNKILIRLSDWKTPTWILKIVASYLTQRSLIVHYQGAHSNPYPLPGAVALGDKLTQLLFLIAVSDAGLDQDISLIPHPLPPHHPGDVHSELTPSPHRSLIAKQD